MDQEPSASAQRASDADRDRTLEVLNDAVAVGRLTLDQHDVRVEAALHAVYVSDLSKLTEDLVTETAPQRPSRKIRRTSIVGVLIFAALIVGIAVAVTNSSAPGSPGTVAPTTNVGVSTAISSPAADSVPPSPFSSVVGGLKIRTVPPGSFGKHDPADECGEFGTAIAMGGDNCYAIIQFMNVSVAPVRFTPADLQMVDQTGDTFSLAPTLPTCFDAIDMHAPLVLRPNKQITVQLCFPVMTGALPETMKGTRSLAGLNLTVPTSSIVGTWGKSDRTRCADKIDISVNLIDSVQQIPHVIAAMGDRSHRPLGVIVADQKSHV